MKADCEVERKKRKREMTSGYSERAVENAREEPNIMSSVCGNAMTL